MRTYILSFLVLTSITANAVNERKLYVGKNSSEAEFSFRFFVDFKSSSAPTEKETKDKVESQVLHLFGPMSVAQAKATPRGNHKLVVEAAKASPRRGFYRANYEYKGTIVVENGPNEHYTAILPFSPDTIYEESAIKRFGGKKTYPCTDSHYDGEGDFWYFWNPANPGCKLKEGSHYAKVTGKITRLANTKRTYPEYSELVHENNEIVISMLLGMDEPKKNRNPLRSNDINASNYREIRNSLIKSGFTGRQWDNREIEKITGKQSEKLPFVEEFSKKEKRATVVVRMFFGPSGIDEDSRAFHFFFKDGVENSSVLIYDGHSGLGDHLDLPQIEKAHGFTLKPKSKYQIYFFNSCSSYSYYNTMFFDRKKSPQDPQGTKNLDILTNGLSTYFSVMHDTNLAVIKAITAWASDKAVISYQALANEIDSGNLFGINGDEDNPTSP